MSNNTEGNQDYIVIKRNFVALDNVLANDNHGNNLVYNRSDSILANALKDIQGFDKRLEIHCSDGGVLRNVEDLEQTRAFLSHLSSVTGDDYGLSEAHVWGGNDKPGMYSLGSLSSPLQARCEHARNEKVSNGR
jgi:hypothetical protein